MKRKLVALIVAIMMIGSCMGAFAVTPNVNDGVTPCYDNDDLAIIAAGLAQYYPTEQEMVGYTIKDGGIYMIMEETTYALDPADQVWYMYAASDLFLKYDASKTQADLQAFLASVVISSTNTKLVEVNADKVIAKNIEELLAQYPGYAEAYRFVDSNKNVTAVLLYNATTGAYVYATLSASTVNPDPEGQPTTGPDAFELDYLQYDDSVISAFAFKPEVFGNGITFSHKNAKSLFSMTVVYDSKVVIQLRDQEGRLYPVSGASYNAADNGYVTTMKAGESKTFGWYGTDGAGYHKAGTLAKPADIWLDLNVTVSTQAKDLDGVALMSGRADMRFDYIVKHGDAAHNGNYSGNSGSNSPKTGDARMAYLTLASLVVLAGVAVVITRKLRTNA